MDMDQKMQSSSIRADVHYPVVLQLIWQRLAAADNLAPTILWTPPLCSGRSVCLQQTQQP